MSGSNDGRPRGAVAGAVALILAGAVLETRTAQAAEEETLEEVTVTGSRIRRSGFEAPNPLTVVDAAQMEKLGQTNVAEVLSSIPQNSAFQSETNVGIVATANTGSNFANLRGLNPFYGTRTLTLVDTKRFVPTSDGGAVDLNVIPSSLIARIETITGGGSAAYGSDAISGVVNVILDKEFTGFKSQMDVGQTFRGDARSEHISLAAGTPFGGDRGHALIGAEWQDNAGVDSCALSRLWCAESWDVFLNSSLVDVGATPQRAAVGAAPQDRNRRYLGQPYYVIAPGSKQAFNVGSGVFRDQANTPVALRYKKFNDDGTALVDMDPGRYRQAQSFGPRAGGDGDSTFEDSALRAPVERYSVFGRTSWDFTDTLEGVLELTYAGREVNVAQQITGPRSTMFVRGDNPYLPASVRALFPAAPADTASLGKDLDSTSFRNVNNSEANTVRVLAGLSGNLFESWRWDGYYQFGRNKRDQTSSRVRTNHFFQYALDAVDEGQFRTGTANGNIVCRATLLAVVPEAAVGCVPMNLFGLDNLTQEAVDYAYREAPEYFRYTQHVVAATANGDLWEGFGAGPVSAAVGAEFRSESGAVSHGDIPYYNEFAFSYGRDFGGDIDVLEGFVEVNAPLLAGAPLARRLDLNAALRQTRNKALDTSSNAVAGSSKSVNITSWKLSTIWDPVEWLRVRGTRSRDIRAAGFRELFQKMTDSETGTTLGSVTNRWISAGDNTPILGGGDFALEPEKADTTTVGMVLSPGGALDGLRLSADWYQIRIKNSITAISAQQVVDYCFNLDIYCDYIQFANATTRADITHVRATQLNLARFTSRGADFELAYRLPLSKLGDWGTGVLDLRTLATLNYDLVVETAPNDPGTDYSGQTGPYFSGGNFNPGPKWQLNTMLSYSLERFTTTLNVRYIPSGMLNATRIGPDDPRYAGLLATAGSSDLVQTGLFTQTISDNRVKGATYFGLTASYKVPFGDDGSWEIFGVINNLLDKDPPIAPGGGGGGGSDYPANPVYFDTLGSQFRAGIRVNF